jgi:sodium/potassium/calcium exchanger 6
MLNLLLGVGGSGTYSILMSPTHKPVMIDFSPTLWVSGTGLLLILAGTALIVPINAFLIDRRWAMCLLVGYAAIMTVNVIVEIRSEGRS